MGQSLQASQGWAVQRVVRKEEWDLKERRDKNLIIFGIPEADRENIRAVVEKLLQECSIKKTINFDNIFRLEQPDKNNSNSGKAKVRPLKPVTDSKSKKGDIVKRINVLKQKGGVCQTWFRSGREVGGFSASSGAKGNQK